MQILFITLTIDIFLIELCPSYANSFKGEQCVNECSISPTIDCGQSALCNYINDMEKKLNCYTVCRRFNDNSGNWRQRFEENKGNHDFQERNIDSIKSIRYSPYHSERESFEVNTKPEENILMVINNDNEDYEFGSMALFDENNILENLRKLNFIMYIGEFLYNLRENSKQMIYDSDGIFQRQLYIYSDDNNFDNVDSLKDTVFSRKKRTSLIEGTRSMFDFRGRIAGQSAGEIETNFKLGPQGITGNVDGKLDYNGKLKGTGTFSMGNLHFDGKYEGGVNGGGKINVTGRLNGSDGGLEGGWAHQGQGDIAGEVKADYLGIKVGSMTGKAKGNYTRDVDITGKLDDGGQFHGLLRSDTQGQISGTSIIGIGHQEYGIGGMVEGEAHGGLQGNYDINSANGDWFGEGKHTFQAGGMLEGGGGLTNLTEVEQLQQELYSSRQQ